jgi:hypothetical protein
VPESSYRIALPRYVANLQVVGVLGRRSGWISTRGAAPADRATSQGRCPTEKLVDNLQVASARTGEYLRGEFNLSDPMGSFTRTVVAIITHRLPSSAA